MIGNTAKATLASAAAMLGVLAAPSMAADTADVELWRLDCGKIEVGDVDYFSDSFLYPGEPKTLTDSCYLIRHGDEYLLWDTGMPASLIGTPLVEGTDTSSLASTIVEQLAEIDVDPADIAYVGISHYHYDHTGQAAMFPGATLLIDRKDWEVVSTREDLSGQFAPWLDGAGKIEQLGWDKDVFGDGSVVLLRTPGHTPGHRSLLVRLEGIGPVLLSGDAAHFRENWTRRAVPSFNTSRAESLASMDRLAEIAAQLGATLIIQHEPGDIAKLAAFPASSR